MHVKTLAEYKRHNAEELLTGLTSACDENIKVFLEKSKMSGKPVKREINSIYRFKHGDKEYFTYHQKLSSQDSLSNYIECWFPGIGKWEKPSFSFITNPETGAKIADSIRSTEIVYELEWPKHWSSDLEMDVVYDISNLVVVDARGKRYGGFSFKDFKEKSLEDLIVYGKYGTYNPTPRIIEVADTKRKELDQKKKSRT